MYHPTVRRFATSQLLVVSLFITDGCKRATTEPPPNPSISMVDALRAPEPDGLTKPDTCNDVEDCAARGLEAFLAGDAQSVAMLAYACVNNSSTACRGLSFALRSGDIPEDPEGAYAAAWRGCKLGEAGACLDLGVDESMGLGGATQDYGAALEHFTAACEGGLAAGCRYVGMLHVEGKLGNPDPASALTWFETGCKKDDSDSCFNAGVLIIESGVGGDLDAAAAYMTHACELGDTDGCAAVAKLAEAATATALAQASKIPDANLQVGSATVNGFTVESLECRVEGGGLGMLGNMALLAALAERKAAVDKCGAKGTVVEVTWTSAGGKITKAEGEGKAGACVAKVIQKLATPVDGECAGTIVLGTQEP
jgi:TPR repeat protein